MAQEQPLPIQQRATDLARYRGNLPAYAEENLRIRTKSAALRPFVFNNAQRIVHSILSEQMRQAGHVRAIILKARQEGISTYVAARNYRRVQLYENQSALVIADQRKRGATLFGIYETFDRKLPEWLKPEKRHQRKGNTLHYDNVHGTGLNSTLVVDTAKDVAAGRGSTIQAVHASELAFWEKPEEPWVALMQAVPDFGSEVVIESTANGVGNMFHQMWDDAEAGESSFVPIFLPWWIHEEYSRLVSPSEREELLENRTPFELKAMDEGFAYRGQQVLLTLEQIAWRRATIRDKLRGDDNVFKQEYPSTAREAFLVSGNCFFDEEVLLDYEEKATKPERFVLSNVGSVITFTPKGRGPVWVWKKPEVVEPKPEDKRKPAVYVIFADTATGKKADGRETIYSSEREQGGRDFSCAWVYDLANREYVCVFHARTPPEDFALRLNQLGFLYSHPNRRTGNRIPALLGVERNHSSGETVVRILKEDLNYPNLYFDRTMNRRRNKLTPAAGWITTEGKRIVMLDDFSAALRAQEAWMPDEATIRECFTFIRDDTGKPEAQDGCHDDRVIAAAGCLQMARHHQAPGLPYERKLVRHGGPAGHLEEDGNGEQRVRRVEASERGARQGAGGADPSGREDHPGRG